MFIYLCESKNSGSLHFVAAMGSVGNTTADPVIRNPESLLRNTFTIGTMHKYNTRSNTNMEPSANPRHSEKLSTEEELLKYMSPSELGR